MTRVVTHTDDLLTQDSTVQDAQALAAGVDTDVPAEPQTALEKLAARRSEWRKGDVKLTVPIPTWDADSTGELAGVFTLLSKDEQKRLAAAQEVVPAGVKKHDHAIRQACLMVGAHCRTLLYDDDPLDADPSFSAFTTEFGAAVYKQRGFQGTPDDYADVVWAAVGRHEPSLMALMRLLARWVANPVVKDWTEPGAGDPFVRI